ncbi:RDD family protein [Cerasicoccus arenae]|uniref:RDD domain-containing protein n=1 Tax=Cerasicoccus arenae TaxID=424488 RepID=A0A8J3GDN7_9BACT|nr:RDD family protein [Cerasicoccus arenae]MBK1859597.1 RDD family protein [Cerasicoccus arenae]GHB92933.1 hypothetical protein GCM10007047_05360 [Cerasicoccus arenae]
MADLPPPSPPPLPQLPVIYIAGRGMRVFCALLDFTIILLLTSFLVSKVFWPQMYPDAWPALLEWNEEVAATYPNYSEPPEAAKEGVGFAQAVCAMVAWIYFYASETITRGSSLGKSVFGLRVISLKRGTYPHPLEIGVRASVKSTCFLLPFPLLFISLFLLLLHRQRRSAHDLLAHTIVIAGPPLLIKPK